MLTLYLGAFTEPTIQENEHIVVLDAASFKTGKGPIPPECMAQNDPIFVSEVLAAAASVPTLKGAFGQVWPTPSTLRSAVRKIELFASP